MDKPDLATIDFYSLLKRGKKLHSAINTMYPKEYDINLVTCLFTYLIFKSGQVPLGQILHEVADVHEIIMFQKGTGALDTMLEEMKLEEEKGSKSEH